MTIKEAIKIICDNRGMFVVNRLIRNYKAYNDKGHKDKFWCEGHKKNHKYTFHKHITVCYGYGMLGFDTAKQVISYATELSNRTQVTHKELNSIYDSVTKDNQP